MATLTIEATPGAGLQQYRFQIDLDHNNIPMIPNDADPPVDTGTVDIQGTCGDGSVHRLFYTLFGAVGSTLALKIFCDGSLRVNIPLGIFGPATVVSSHVEFVL
jgi:hypothetical protein